MKRIREKFLKNFTLETQLPNAIVVDATNATEQQQPSTPINQPISSSLHPLFNITNNTPPKAERNQPKPTSLVTAIAPEKPFDSDSIVPTDTVIPQDPMQFFDEHPDEHKYHRGISKLHNSFLKIITPINTTKIIEVPHHDKPEDKYVGIGSQGAVKIGHDINYTTKKLAVKICLAEKSEIDSLMTEAHILNKLEQLDGTMVRKTKKVNERDEPLYKLYIISEFFSNSITLKKYLKIKPNLSKIKKLQIISKIIEQLKLFHKKGIVQGDLNFNNILINKSRAIRIIDCGYAHELNANAVAKFTKKSRCVDGAPWLAPERDPWHASKLLEEIQTTNPQQYSDIHQWTEEGDGYGFYNLSSDIYSLGWNIDMFMNINPEDPDLTKLCKKMIDPNPFKRLTLEELKTQIKELINKETMLATHQVSPSF